MVADPPSFSARLRDAIDGAGSLLCIGLDPDGCADAAAAEAQCARLLDASLPHACAVKLNLAFFEQHGSAGYAVAERVRHRVPADRILIIDGKRGDVGHSSEAYARSLFDVLGADAVTVNPLMGRDSVQPFLDREGRGAFILARTSNPGAADFLDRDAASGQRLFERIVAEAQTWTTTAGAVGFVVGATAPDAVAWVRRLAPSAPLLLPGVGAQGGELEAAVTAALDADGRGALVAVSRALTAADDGPAAACARLNERVAAVRGR